LDIKNLTSNDIFIQSLGVTILANESRRLEEIANKSSIKNSEIPGLIISGQLQVVDVHGSIVNDLTEITEEFRVIRKPTIQFIGTDKLPNLHNSLIPYTNIGKLDTSRVSAGATFAIPFYLSKPFQINEIGVMFTDKQLANYRIVIAAGTTPIDVVVDTNIKTTNSSGLFQHTVNYLLEDKIYWIVFQCDVAKQLRFVKQEAVQSIIGLCGCEKHVTHLYSDSCDLNNLSATNWDYMSADVPALFLYGEFL